MSDTKRPANPQTVRSEDDWLCLQDNLAHVETFYRELVALILTGDFKFPVNLAHGSTAGSEAIRKVEAWRASEWEQTTAGASPKFASDAVVTRAIKRVTRDHEGLIKALAGAGRAEPPIFGDTPAQEALLRGDAEPGQHRTDREALVRKLSAVEAMKEDYERAITFWKTRALRAEQSLDSAEGLETEDARRLAESFGHWSGLTEAEQESVIAKLARALPPRSEAASSEVEGDDWPPLRVTRATGQARSEGAAEERQRIVAWMRSDETTRLGCSAGGIARLDKLADEIEAGAVVPEKGEG